jgi:hypothetical protein
MNVSMYISYLFISGMDVSTYQHPLSKASISRWNLAASDLFSVPCGPQRTPDCARNE